MCSVLVLSLAFYIHSLFLLGYVGGSGWVVLLYAGVGGVESKQVCSSLLQLRMALISLLPGTTGNWNSSNYQ